MIKRARQGPRLGNKISNGQVSLQVTCQIGFRGMRPADRMPRNLSYSIQKFLVPLRQVAIC